MRPLERPPHSDLKRWERRIRSVGVEAVEVPYALDRESLRQVIQDAGADVHPGFRRIARIDPVRAHSCIDERPPRARAEIALAADRELPAVDVVPRVVVEDSLDR